MRGTTDEGSSRSGHQAQAIPESGASSVAGRPLPVSAAEGMKENRHLWRPGDAELVLDAEIYGQGEQREVIHRGFELCPRLHIESAHGFRQGPISMMRLVHAM